MEWPGCNIIPDENSIFNMFGQSNISFRKHLYNSFFIMHHLIRTSHVKSQHILGLWWKISPWWRHQMETFFALLALCAGNWPVTDEFPSHRPVMRSFDAFFDLRLNKRLSKQSWGWWFETPSCPLLHHSNAQSNTCFLFYELYLTLNGGNFMDIIFKYVFCKSAFVMLQSIPIHK